jgi:putative transposase
LPGAAPDAWRRAAGRQAPRQARRTTIPDPDAQPRPDLVCRDFTAEAPDRLWVGDFTYLRCWEGRLFFSFIIDVFSRKIVGWQLASHMRTDLVLDALRMALGTRDLGADFALVQHIDHGSQYLSHDYAQVLDDHRVLASVGTVGDAYDNALAESFVDTFKTELIKDHDRLHESLDDVPPVEFEDAYRALTTPSGSSLTYGAEQAH